MEGDLGVALTQSLNGTSSTRVLTPTEAMAVGEALIKFAAIVQAKKNVSPHGNPLEEPNHD